MFCKTLVAVAYVGNCQKRLEIVNLHERAVKIHGSIASTMCVGETTTKLILPRGSGLVILDMDSTL